jgi:SAM-dependent methyltransferase
VELDEVGPPAAFVDLADGFPSTGTALDVACGDGRGAVWLAIRGLRVRGLDVSPEAVALASDLALRAGVGTGCRVEVADLDEGLPAGEPADLVVCHLFSAPRLDDALVTALRPGGLLAVAVLSEVGGPPGRFRARPGELLDRFGSDDRLDLLDHREADGVARLLARRASR